jgi:hypothetical protein
MRKKWKERKRNRRVMTRGEEKEKEEVPAFVPTRNTCESIGY